MQLDIFEGIEGYLNGLRAKRHIKAKEGMT